MSIVASAWASVLGMFVWAAYLYFHWSGVDTLPMPGVLRRRRKQECSFLKKRTKKLLVL